MLDTRKLDYRFVKVAGEMSGEIPDCCITTLIWRYPQKETKDDYSESQRTQLGTDRPR